MTRHAAAVHQILATLGYGDAIGNEVLGIHRALRAAGYESEIIVETADPRLEDLTVDYRDMVGEVGADDLLIHHFSLGLARVAHGVRAAGADDARSTTTSRRRNTSSACTTSSCASAITAAASCCRTDRACDLALGDSEFNRQELEALGFPPTGVLPVVPDFSHLDVPPGRARARRRTTTTGRTSCSSAA